MPSTRPAFVGVDPTAARKAFTYAALDGELNVVCLEEGELEEVLDYLAGQPSALVAVNSPSRLNSGLVRKSLAAKAAAGHQLRGVDLRLAEHQLRERGIAVGGTPSREALCPGWVRAGFLLFEALSAREFQPHPAPDASHAWLETHPHAAFCALLRQAPLSKASVEGRLQRQLALHEKGVRVRDPMLYFEEITRHKLLHGILPSDMAYPPEQLDALVAAYTAWTAVRKPAEVTALGDASEGLIWLPAAPLQDKY